MPEFDALVDGLEAGRAAALKPGGFLAVVSFHSLEGLVVKRFLAQRAAGTGGCGNRFAPEAPQRSARFELIERGHFRRCGRVWTPTRAPRSARLRLAAAAPTPPQPGRPRRVGVAPHIRGVTDAKLVVSAGRLWR